MASILTFGRGMAARSLNGSLTVSRRAAVVQKRTSTSTCARACEASAPLLTAMGVLFNGVSVVDVRDNRIGDTDVAVIAETLEADKLKVSKLVLRATESFRGRCNPEQCSDNERASRRRNLQDQVGLDHRPRSVAQRPVSRRRRNG